MIFLSLHFPLFFTFVVRLISTYRSFLFLQSSLPISSPTQTVLSPVRYVKSLDPSLFIFLFFNFCRPYYLYSSFFPFPYKSFSISSFYLSHSPFLSSPTQTVLSPVRYVKSLDPSLPSFSSFLTFVVRLIFRYSSLPFLQSS